jgi:hypothetical protein
MKLALKIIAIFSLILLSQSNKTDETVRLLEETQPTNTTEKKEIAEPKKIYLGEVQTEAKQESPTESNAETQVSNIETQIEKDGEGRFLQCSRNGVACWTHKMCCSGFCLVFCDTRK